MNTDTNNLPKHYSRVKDRWSLIGLMGDNKTTRTKTGQYARIIELVGKDYTGMEQGSIDGHYNTREQFFQSVPNNIIIFSHTHRREVEREMDEDAYSIPMASAVAKEWAKTFRKTYRTYHYIIIASTKGDVVDFLAEMDKKRQGEDIDLYSQLEEYTDSVLSELRNFKPRLLEGDDHVSYWAWMLNGNRSKCVVPDYGLYDDYLCAADLVWPKGKKYQIYKGDKDLYSGWLSIKKPRDRTTASLINELCRQSVPFSIYQVFSSVLKENALSEVESLGGNVANLEKHTDSILMELAAFADGLQSGAFSMLNHRFSLEIFGDNVDELNKNVHDLQQITGSERFLTMRESTNQEPLYWSKFPDMQQYNSRVRHPTSENAAHLVTFSSVSRGSETCTWGNMPITRFRTNSGTNYSLILHDSEDDKALGHTLFVGGSNSGKTTIANFLISQCMKYPKFRFLGFDRLHGMKVFTEMHDGDYLDFADRIKLNPLSLDNSSDSKAFLQSWFEMLLSATSEEDKNKINGCIVQLYELKKKDRLLENIKEAFGLKKAGSLRGNLDKWLPGGSYDSFFTSLDDSLSFDKQIVCCDMTTVMDNKDLLPVLSSYIFYRLLREAGKEGGFAVFIDEAPAYFGIDVFRLWVERLLQEIRKKEGVLMLAGQSLDPFLKPGIKQLILNNIATYVLWPEPNADEESYMGDLGLTDGEFRFIKEGKQREVLVKRKAGGESVQLNVDLSPIGKYLNGFNSSSDEVARLNRLQSEGGDWKERFLCEK